MTRKRSTDYPLPERSPRDSVWTGWFRADTTWLKGNLKEGIRKVAFESED